MYKSLRRALPTYLLFVGCLLLLTDCGARKEEENSLLLVQEEDGGGFATTVADYGEVEKNVRVNCTYTATEERSLSFPVSNKMIVKVEVGRGDFVAKGDLLAALDVEALEDAIEEEEYRVKSLELQLKQTQELYEFDLNSADVLYTYTHRTEEDKEALQDKKEAIEQQYKNTLVDLEDSLLLERKRLTQYRQEWDEGQLIADLDGEITYLASPLKNTFSRAGETVVTISNLDTCYFIADNAEYKDYFPEGENVTVNYWNGKQSVPCDTLPIYLEDSGQLMFKPIEESIINNGANGTIKLLLERKTNVLCVMKSAIHSSDKGPFVYLYQDGLLKMCYVTVGLEGDSMVEITAGLEAGDILALKK